jgi:hypothetical protein
MLTSLALLRIHPLGCRLWDPSVTSRLAEGAMGCQRTLVDAHVSH